MAAACLACVLVLPYGTAAVDRPAGAAPARAAAASERDYAGRWESVSDDGTFAEILEVAFSNGAMRGGITDIERGYFSSRQTVRDEFTLRGTVTANGEFDVELRDVSDPGTPIAGHMFRRGEYLVIRIGPKEIGFARPGRSLVQGAEGSADALALARAIGGRVYASTSQAAGRGAFVGARTRLALCSDGRIEYAASDLATSGPSAGGGVDAGDAVSRRGAWSIVLLAGAPVVRAEWQGTGSSYSLTRYFVVRPSPDGRSIDLDGARIPLTGGC